MLKKLVRERKIRHLHIRVYEGTDDEKWEVIFTSSQYPYWRKTQRTDDELLVEETFQLWTNHARVLQFLPPRLCHDMITGKQLETPHILLQNITAFDIKYFYEGFDYRTGSIFYTSNSDRPAIGLVSQHINLDVKL